VAASPSFFSFFILPLHLNARMLLLFNPTALNCHCHACFGGSEIQIWSPSTQETVTAAARDRCISTEDSSPEPLAKRVRDSASQICPGQESRSWPVSAESKSSDSQPPAESRSAQCLPRKGEDHGHSQRLSG